VFIAFVTKKLSDAEHIEQHGDDSEQDDCLVRVARSTECLAVGLQFFDEQLRAAGKLARVALAASDDSSAAEAMIELAHRLTTVASEIATFHGTDPVASETCHW
jgi:hypothetical protein